VISCCINISEGKYLKIGGNQNSLFISMLSSDSSTNYLISGFLGESYLISTIPVKKVLLCSMFYPLRPLFSDLSLFNALDDLTLVSFPLLFGVFILVATA
jgi:hypothetical protein